MERKRSCLCKTMTASSLSENIPVDKTLPDKDVKALLKRIRIHPEAQRILGNSHVPIVCLERLSIRTAPNLPVLLQPVVPLIRLPCLTLSGDQHVFNEDHPHQNVSYQNKEDITEITEMVSLTKPETPSSPEQSDIIVYNYNECCTQPSSPGSSYSEAEQGFYCDTNYIQIVTAGKHVNVDSEMEPFNLDLEENQEVVIIVDPEPDPSLLGLEQSSYADVDHECESNWEAELVCDSDASPAAHECCASVQQPVPEVAVMESDDFCAVCLIGGELLCCDRCPKVYHLACHIPSLISFPLGDWVCTLCRSDEDPADNYECGTIHSCGVTSAPYSLSNQDQRRCEKLTLLLSCHELSAPFHEPVSPLARNYYQIIKRPIDLSVIRRKLDKCITLHYFNVEQFIDDVLLMFKNCATFNYPDSEVAQAGRKLELFFLCKLKEVFPDQTFPAANQDIMERARLQWLNGKKKESHKKRKHVFSAKQYCL